VGHLDFQVRQLCFQLLTLPSHRHQINFRFFLKGIYIAGNIQIEIVFLTGLIKSISKDSVAATIEKLALNVRRVFDYLRMTRQ